MQSVIVSMSSRGSFSQFTNSSQYVTSARDVKGPTVLSERCTKTTFADASAEGTTGGG